MDDTGPPLHYLLARLLLLPVGAPGPADVVVRLLSVAASLLHLPLLLRIARRTGDSALGWRAAALFALCPAAVAYGAEGRAYPLASLLALAALERSLALRDGPSFPATLGAALCSAGAVLTHYLALFPLAGLVWLLVRAEGAARRRLVGAWALGALVALPWAPVALYQPAGGLAWIRAVPVGDRVRGSSPGWCSGSTCRSSPWWRRRPRASCSRASCGAVAGGTHASPACSPAASRPSASRASSVPTC